MFKEERLQKVQAIIEERGTVSVEDLAAELKTSQMTIRRDLQFLSINGCIERTHGGAVSLRNDNLFLTPSFSVQSKKNLEEKLIIAKKVASMIGSGEKIYLSAGTTTYCLANVLLNRDDIIVITNSLTNAALLAQNPYIEIIMVGGFLRHKELSLVGHFAKTVVSQLHIDKTILGIRGIHPVHGFTSDYPRDMMNDRSFMHSTENVIIVADHTKFGHIGASVTAPITVAKTIVTTSKAPEDMIKEIRTQGVEIILADES